MALILLREFHQGSQVCDLRKFNFNVVTLDVFFSGFEFLILCLLQDKIDYALSSPK